MIRQIDPVSPGRSLPLEAGRVLLGLVLTCAPAMKVLSLRAFFLSVERLTGLPDAVAPLAAVLLIAAEGATGILLLTRRLMRVAASAALLLFLAFAVMLSSATVRGLEIPCRCFGSFLPVFSPLTQCILDLVFAAIALLLITPPGRTEGRSLRRVGFTGGLLWAVGLLLWPPPDRSELPPSPLADDFAIEGGTGRPALLLLADFDDFGCQLCLEDFLALCDSVNTEPISSYASVRLLVRRDTARSLREQERVLEGWASGNSYRFPFSVDSDGFYERSRAGKTSALVWGKEGRLLEFARFPLGVRKRLDLLRALSP